MYIFCSRYFKNYFTYTIVTKRDIKWEFFSVLTEGMKNRKTGIEDVKEIDFA